MLSATRHGLISCTQQKIISKRAAVLKGGFLRSELKRGGVHISDEIGVDFTDMEKKLKLYIDKGRVPGPVEVREEAGDIRQT